MLLCIPDETGHDPQMHIRGLEIRILPGLNVETVKAHFRIFAKDKTAPIFTEYNRIIQNIPFTQITMQAKSDNGSIGSEAGYWCDYKICGKPQ
jgi:hypothetical protein